MKFLEFITSMFLLYSTSLNLVKGKPSDEEKNDCTKLYNFKNGSSIDMDDICCKENVGIGVVECDDEGYVKVYSSVGTEFNDFSSFPFLSRIERLYINHYGLNEIPESILKLTSLKELDLQVNNIQEISPAIQNLKQLEQLYLYNNKISKLPNEVFNLKNLKTLNITKNHLDEIPPAIQNFSQLEILNLNENNIRKLPDEISNLKHLKSLSLNNNNIGVFPPGIQKLSQLEELHLNYNNIRELPNEISNLTNLKKLNIGNNPSLEAKIINFGNTPIEECDFNAINVSCYQLHTCKLIKYNNLEFADMNAENHLKTCSKEDVDRIINQKETNDSKYYIIGGIISGCIIFILISTLVVFIFIKKNKSKNHDKSRFGSKENLRSDTIKIELLTKKLNKTDDDDKINNNNNNNNNSNDDNYNPNNTNAGINNNGSINSINGSDIQNILNQNNLNPIILNSNSLNSNILPLGIVLLNNPQNSANYIMSSIPIHNNNSNNQNINNGGQIDIENWLHYEKCKLSMKAKKADEYCTFVNEEEESPPEYSEINKLISK